MESELLIHASFAQWKKKRSRTLVAFIIIGAIVGIDYSIVLSTLYVYLKDMIQSDKPKVYYGVIIAIFNISSTIFGVLSGWLVDKSRRIRLYINIVFIIQIIGSLLYTIPFSVAFPIIGRLLAGVADPFGNVCSGELIRIYDDEGSTKALWWLASTYSFGFIVGPGLSLLFQQVNFNIGIVTVTNLNFVGLFMAGLSILAMFVANTLVYDCSKEFDLKEYEKQQQKKAYNREKKNNGKKNIITNVNDDFPEVTFSYITSAHQMTPLLTVKGLLTNFDSVLLLFTTYVTMFSLFGTDLMIPLLVSNTFYWKQVAVSYIFIAYGIAYLIILIIMMKLCSTSRSVYIATIICLVFALVQYASLFVIENGVREKTRDIVLFILYLFCWMIGWCIEEVLIRNMIGKMVPSCVQSFTETFRSGCARISAIMVSLLIPLLMTYLQMYIVVMFIIFFVLFVCFIVRKEYLKNPREIHFF